MMSDRSSKFTGADALTSFLFDMKQPRPPIKGRPLLEVDRLVEIVAGSGNLGVEVADAMSRSGMERQIFTDTLVKAVSDGLVRTDETNGEVRVYPSALASSLYKQE